MEEAPIQPKEGLTFLAIDGGQTASRAALVTETGRVLARAQAGGHTHVVAPAGASMLRSSLVDLRDAVAAHGPPIAVFIGTCAVTTGTRSQSIGEEVAAEVFPGSRRRIDGDSVGAWAAGTGGRAGVVVVAGTGSVVAAYNERGDWAETGGWGHLFGDPGSGWCIGSAAIRSVLRRWDKEQAVSPLGRAILESMSVATPIEILFAVYGSGSDPVQVARLSRVVGRCVAEGDAEAISIVEGCARALAEDVASAIGRLDWESEPVLVVTLGNAPKVGPQHRASFLAALEAVSPRPVSVADPVLSVLGGGALLALRLGGIEPTGTIVRQLVDTGLGLT